MTSSWPYKSLPYDDYIEVLDMLDEERRVWLDWEDNRFGKRGFAQMIYYTNIGTIAPDNSYLVFTGDGTLVGQLSSSFVSSLRNGDVFLLGGSTYRVASVRGTRVNVTPATGYRPTIPSWTGEANSRTHELSQAVLRLLSQISVGARMATDYEPIQQKHTAQQARSIRAGIFLDEHVATTFQVPSNDRILIEQVDFSANLCCDYL